MPEPTTVKANPPVLGGGPAEAAATGEQHLGSRYTHALTHLFFYLFIDLFKNYLCPITCRYKQAWRMELGPQKG